MLGTQHERDRERHDTHWASPTYLWVVIWLFTVLGSASPGFGQGGSIGIYADTSLAAVSAPCSDYMTLYVYLIPDGGLVAGVTSVAYRITQSNPSGFDYVEDFTAPQRFNLPGESGALSPGGVYAVYTGCEDGSDERRCLP